MYTKEFYKAQAAYFDACNVEQLAWLSYNRLQEKTEDTYGEDDQVIKADTSERLIAEVEEAKKKHLSSRILTQEAKKRYQECGAIV